MGGPAMTTTLHEVQATAANHRPDVELAAKPGLLHRVRSILGAVVSGGGVQTAENLDNQPPFDIAEMKSLVRFAADRGLDTNAGVVHTLGVALRKLTTQAEWDNLNLVDALEIAAQYTSLQKVTYETLEVSGRTVRDSATHGTTVLSMTGIYFICFFLLAVAPDLAVRYVSNTDLWAGLLDFFKQLAPFFWGGVGATVFLMKSISEIASQSRFDSRRLHGVGPRVFLGAAIAYIVVEVFHKFVINTPSSAQIGFNLTDTGIAFLSGLGVKAIYGAFEGLVEGISNRINIGKGK